MATENAVNRVPHDYQAKALWESIIGYTDGDSVDIQLTIDSQEKIRIVAMHNAWSDELFLKEPGEHLKNELEAEGFDHKFMYYFIAGPVSRFENQNWQDCIVYVDKKTYGLFQRFGIINSYRKMPDKVYDLAFAEAERLSWEV